MTYSLVLSRSSSTDLLTTHSLLVFQLSRLYLIKLDALNGQLHYYASDAPGGAIKGSIRMHGCAIRLSRDVDELGGLGLGGGLSGGSGGGLGGGLGGAARDSARSSARSRTGSANANRSRTASALSAVKEGVGLADDAGGDPELELVLQPAEAAEGFDAREFTLRAASEASLQAWLNLLIPLSLAAAPQVLTSAVSFFFYLLTTHSSTRSTLTTSLLDAHSSRSRLVSLARRRAAAARPPRQPAAGGEGEGGPAHAQGRPAWQHDGVVPLGAALLPHRPHQRHAELVRGGPAGREDEGRAAAARGAHRPVQHRG